MQRPPRKPSHPAVAESSQVHRPRVPRAMSQLQFFHEPSGTQKVISYRQVPEYWLDDRVLCEQVRLGRLWPIVERFPSLPGGIVSIGIFRMQSTAPHFQSPPNPFNRHALNRYRFGEDSAACREPVRTKVLRMS
jgi:hypothetical protein